MGDEMLGDIFTVPKNIVFPNELNGFLKDQIVVLAQENAGLHNRLEIEHQKRQELEKKIDELNRATQNQILPSFLPQTGQSKVVELSKNYREKCAELEKYKTKYSKLLKQLSEEKDDIPIPAPPPATKDPVIEETELKQLKDKLSTVTNKMLELKNANIQLKNELRQANKVLQLEVGEDLSSALTGNGTWRGRAQLICDLQEKNRKLKQMVQNSSQPISVEKTPTKPLEEEIERLKTVNEVLQKKVEALHSRSEAMKVEHQTCRPRLQEMEQRSSRDSEIIQLLKKQIGEVEQGKRALLKTKDMEVLKLRKEIEMLKTQMKDYKTLVDKLKKPKKEDITVETKVAGRTENGLLKLLENYRKRMQEYGEEVARFREAAKLQNLKMAERELAAQTNRSGYSSMLKSSRSELALKNQLELAEENVKIIETRLRLEQAERQRDFQEFSEIVQKGLPNN